MKSKAELKALEGVLDKLTAKFAAAWAERKSWMDAHMEDFARFKVGDEIFNLETGERLGEISQLYRYWGSDNRDPQYDTTMDIQYQYHTGNNCFDNTSRRYLPIGTKADLDARQKLRSEVFALGNWDAAFAEKR